MKEVIFTEDCTGEQYCSTIDANLNLFEQDELKTLFYIDEYFRDFSSKQITDLSHLEAGYLNTRNGEVIEYSFAEQLSI